MFRGSIVFYLISKWDSGGSDPLFYPFLSFVYTTIYLLSTTSSDASVGS